MEANFRFGYSSFFHSCWPLLDQNNFIWKDSYFLFFFISRKDSYFHMYKFTITFQSCTSNIIMGLLYFIRNDKHTRTFSLLISNSVANASYFLNSIHYWWSSNVLYIINEHFKVSWCQWILSDLLPIERDTVRVWGKSNLSDMINEGWLDVYFLYFFGLYGISIHSSIKRIDKLTPKANPKGNKYHHPKEFS